MTIFLILAPFGSFALLMLVTSAEISTVRIGGDLSRRHRHRRLCAAARSRYSARAASSSSPGSAPTSR